MSCIIEFEKCQESLFSLQPKLKQIILVRAERGGGGNPSFHLISMCTHILSLVVKRQPFHNSLQQIDEKKAKPLSQGLCLCSVFVQCPEH